MKDKLIILDMDNTILQSRIDFPAMRAAVHDLLDAAGLGQYKHRSAAQSLQDYCDSAEYSPDLAAQMWHTVSEIEEEGMAQAVLEPGALAALAYLRPHAAIAVLTNNTDINLDTHLGRLGLLPYIDYVAGRDSVPRLKPAPDGVLHVMAQFPHIARERMVCVGDAWNDSVSAAAAGCAFVAYNRSRNEHWDELGVQPVLRLTAWNDAACDALLRVGDA